LSVIASLPISVGAANRGLLLVGSVAVKSRLRATARGLCFSRHHDAGGGLKHARHY